jgi:hypothetical protein
MSLLFLKRLNDSFEENAERLIEEGKTLSEYNANFLNSQHELIEAFASQLALTKLSPIIRASF